VLNADVQAHQAKIAKLQTIAARYQDTVALFAALGGGWWNPKNEHF
jgi:outer membrane protein TolC